MTNGNGISASAASRQTSVWIVYGGAITIWRRTRGLLMGAYLEMPAAKERS